MPRLLRLVGATLALLLVVQAGPVSGAVQAHAETRTVLSGHYTALDGGRMRSATALAHGADDGWAWRSARGVRTSRLRWVSGASSRIDGVRIVGVGRQLRGATARIRFGDGSVVTVSADSRGHMASTFRARSVKSATMRLRTPQSLGSVVLRSWSFVRVVTPHVGRSTLAPAGAGSAPAASGSAQDGEVPATRPDATAAEAHSNTGSPTPALEAASKASQTAAMWAEVDDRRVAALTDARADLPATTGTSWTSSSPTTAVVVLRFPSPTVVDALQLYGSPDAAVRSGTATFDDGTAVSLLPVPAASRPVTVAFPSRTSGSIVLRLVSSSHPALSEIAAYGRDEIAPTAGGEVHPALMVASAAPCSGAAASSTAGLRLVCPATGSGVQGATSLVVSGPEGSVVTASSLLADGARAELATGTIRRGAVELDFDASRLPSGPLTIRLSATGVDRPLRVQLVNRSGAAPDMPSAGPIAGRDLVFDDEFDGGLSVTRTGADAEYAATKPASWGTSEFGDAVFADPTTNTENLSTVDGGYLRIRTTPLGAGERDPAGWGRRYRGGILSSASINGGFAAQHAYFETRMLAPSSPGTWPAFWMMSGSFLGDSSSAKNSEVDAVELYGHDPTYACHSWADWTGVGGHDGGRIDCTDRSADWSAAWHTYGVDITPSATRYYVDGNLVATAAAVRGADEPFYFMLNLSLGGGWPVDLDGVNGVTDLYVDYVRVYV